MRTTLHGDDDMVMGQGFQKAHLSACTKQVKCVGVLVRYVCACACLSACDASETTPN